MNVNARLLVLSNHHRTSLFFNDTVKRILQLDPVSVILLETGGGAPLSGMTLDMEDLVRQGKISHIGNGASISYDQGMTKLYNHTKDRTDYDVILLIDNDCFLSGLDHLVKYVNEFVEGDYDFASHLVRADDYGRLKLSYSDNCICPVTDQRFHDSDIPPYFVPVPHWENSYTLISRSIWQKLADCDQPLSHSRRWIRYMYELGAKFGAHRCNHRLTFSHFGDEWFHVGALMASYYRVIKVDLNVDPSSIIEASRIGYFAAQERHYGEIYHDIDKAKLQRFYNHFGGKSAVLSAWDELTKDTCMQDWVVYERAS